MTHDEEKKPSRLERETLAAKAIVEMVSAEGDDDLTIDMVDGETGFLDIIGWMLDKMNEDQVIVTGCKDLIETYTDRKKAAENRIARTKSTIEVALMQAGLDDKPIKLAQGTLSIRASQPSLGELDEAEIPSQFWVKQPPKLDKKALLAVMKEGEAVPGAKLNPPSRTMAFRRK